MYTEQTIYLRTQNHTLEVIETEGDGLLVFADAGLNESDNLPDDSSTLHFDLKDDRLLLSCFTHGIGEAGLKPMVKPESFIAFGKLPELFVFDEEFYKLRDVPDEYRQYWTIYYHANLHLPVMLSGSFLAVRTDEGPMLTGENRGRRTELQRFDCNEASKLYFREGVLVHSESLSLSEIDL